MQGRLAKGMIAWGWWGLMVLQLIWHGLLAAPGGNQNLWLTAIAATPLAVLTPGVLRFDRRTLFWSMILVMLYFVVAIMELWSNPPQRWPASAQLLLCLNYFAGLVLFSRQPPPR